MQKQLQQIRQFHEKFGDYLQDKPNPEIPTSQVELRNKLMQEELGELLLAMDDKDIVAIAHELVDVLYVVFGTAETYGLSEILEKVFDEVHKSNMSKEYEQGKKARKGKDYQSADVKQFFE